MQTKAILVGLSIVGLVVVNIAAFKYLSFFGFFFTAACIPFVERIFNIIEKMK